MENHNDNRIKNRVQHLRDHLFEVLEGLKDDEKPMETDRALAVCKVSEQIIKSAEVEVRLLEVIARDKPLSNFFDPQSELPVTLTAGGSGERNGRKQ